MHCLCPVSKVESPHSLNLDTRTEVPLSDEQSQAWQRRDHSRDLTGLGWLEADVLRVVWDKGEVTVRVSEGNHIVVGKGSSTDIIEASAKAYVHALNRLNYKQKRVSEGV